MCTNDIEFIHSWKIRDWCGEPNSESKFERLQIFLSHFFRKFVPITFMLLISVKTFQIFVSLSLLFLSFEFFLMDLKNEKKVLQFRVCLEINILRKITLFNLLRAGRSNKRLTKFENKGYTLCSFTIFACSQNMLLKWTSFSSYGFIIKFFGSL